MKNNCVIIPNPLKLSRGVDLSKHEDVMFVIQFCSNHWQTRTNASSSFDKTNLMQQLGRSNRSRGAHEGVVIVVSDF